MFIFRRLSRDSPWCELRYLIKSRISIIFTWIKDTASSCCASPLKAEKTSDRKYWIHTNSLLTLCFTSICLYYKELMKFKTTFSLAREPSSKEKSSPCCTSGQACDMVQEAPRTTVDYTVTIQTSWYQKLVPRMELAKKNKFILEWLHTHTLHSQDSGLRIWTNNNCNFLIHLLDHVQTAESTKALPDRQFYNNLVSPSFLYI